MEEKSILGNDIFSHFGTQALPEESVCVAFLRSRKYRTVSATKKVRPATRLMRESHQVLPMDATTTAKPIIDPHLPRGERAGISATCAGLRRRRKLICAASDTTQESIMPKNAPRRMYSKAFAGAQRSRTRATTIP